MHAPTSSRVTQARQRQHSGLPAASRGLSAASHSAAQDAGGAARRCGGGGGGGGGVVLNIAQQADASAEVQARERGLQCREGSKDWVSEGENQARASSI